MANPVVEQAHNVIIGLSPVWVASGVFVGTYAVIVTEKINRAIVALMGAGLMIVLGVLNQEAAIRRIDFNTLGLLTGICLSFVGVTFPILLPYFVSGGQMHWGLFSLAYASGYSGVLVSPLHLCLSTTVAYFKADMRKFYRMLALPVIILFLVGLLLAFIN